MVGMPGARHQVDPVIVLIVEGGSVVRICARFGNVQNCGTVDLNLPSLLLPACNASLKQSSGEQQIAILHGKTCPACPAGDNRTNEGAICQTAGGVIPYGKAWLLLPVARKYC